MQAKLKKKEEGALPEEEKKVEKPIIQLDDS